MGIVASKVIPEIKEDNLSKWNNDKWATMPMKSTHRNDAKVWFQGGEARIGNEEIAGMFDFAHNYGQIDKIYIAKRDDVDYWTLLKNNS